MIETLTLAHFSDLHLGPIQGFGWGACTLKRGLGYLNWWRSRRGHHLMRVAEALAADAVAQRPDHFAVTGDLLNLGLPGEFELAARWLASLGGPDRVSLVPGNHDIYASLDDAAAFLSHFRLFMASSHGEAAGAQGGFPFVRLLGPVALIGVNSAVPTPPFVAAGLVGDGQRTALAAALDRLGKAGYVRVVMIHHPPLPGQAPPRRALKDAVALQDVLDRAGAELVLHGHNHTNTLVWRTSACGAVPVLGVASGSAGRVHKHEPLARYTLIRISRPRGEAAEIDLTARGLLDADGPVVELERFSLAAARQAAGVT